MEAAINKSKLVQKLTDRYDLKHGDWIEVERLYDIAEKEKIETKDILKIFGIANKRNSDEDSTIIRAKIKLYEPEELVDMKQDILNEIMGLKRRTQKDLEEVGRKYKVNLWILIGMLNNCLTPKETRRKQEVKEKDKKEEYELLLKEAKYKDYITKEILIDWIQRYKLEDKEICKILKINSINYNNLMNSKTVRMRIDLISDKEKKQIESKIKRICLKEDFIDKKRIETLKQEIKTTDRLIRNTLIIASSTYKRIMADESKKTKIIDKDLRRKINILKMDMKYVYGERNYTIEELKDICAEYEIKIKDFLKNLGRNVKRYSYEVEALSKNKNGIYIGREHPVSHQFAEQNVEEIQKLCKKMTNKYFYYSYLKNDKEDMFQEACLLILEKGGIIEKNFSFDEELLFGLLANRVKYHIFKKRHREILELPYEWYEREIEGVGGFETWNDNMILEIVESMDKRIKTIHQKVMKIFLYNKDFINQNRGEAYKIIAHKLNIPIEYLEKVIEEIKEFWLEYHFAKICKDGRIINMTDACYF